jgi:hypothetical protein
MPSVLFLRRDHLIKISRGLTEELDLDKLLDRIPQYAIEVLDAHAGSIAPHQSPLAIH